MSEMEMVGVGAGNHRVVYSSSGMRWPVLEVLKKKRRMGVGRGSLLLSEWLAEKKTTNTQMESRPCCPGS